MLSCIYYGMNNVEATYSFVAIRSISIDVNSKYLQLKLPKYKENKKIRKTFDQNLENIP